MLSLLTYVWLFEVYIHASHNQCINDYPEHCQLNSTHPESHIYSSICDIFLPVQVIHIHDDLSTTTISIFQLDANISNLIPLAYSRSAFNAEHEYVDQFMDMDPCRWSSWSDWTECSLHDIDDEQASFQYKSRICSHCNKTRHGKRNRASINVKDVNADDDECEADDIELELKSCDTDPKHDKMSLYILCFCIGIFMIGIWWCCQTNRAIHVRSQQEASNQEEEGGQTNIDESSSDSFVDIDSIDSFEYSHRGSDADELLY